MSLCEFDLQRLEACCASVQEVLKKINKLDDERIALLDTLEALEESIQKLEDKSGSNSPTDNCTLIQQDCIPKFLLVQSNH
mgnify:CR=1 FL=1